VPLKKTTTPGGVERKEEVSQLEKVDKIYRKRE
jgi:hypothetical protein